MGLALIGAYAGDKDTHLKDVAQTPPNITNNNYHIAAPTNPAPELPPMFVQTSPDPVPQQKIIYVEQPRPEPAPDTTIVVYKPEVRQPVQKVVVIDERYERLKAEHEARMREWTSGPVVVVR